MDAVKASFLEAQNVKDFLLSHDFINKEFKVLKKNKAVFFPVKKESVKQLKKEHFEVVEEDFEKSRIEEKQDKIEMPSSFDVIGSTIIIEIPEEMEKKEIEIADFLLKKNKNITTVLKKAEHFQGVFRTRKLAFLAGKKTKEAIHRENGVQIKLDLETVYFSSRLSSERKRISGLVQKDEEILVMFSGCGPYVCVLSKNTEAKTVYGVEINPAAHKYALENVKLNKLKNAFLYEGDVRVVVPKLNKRFDRILMPLPKSAKNFLDIALSVSKKGSIIHFYDFQKEENIPASSIAKIDAACIKHNIKYHVLEVVKCGQCAPYEFRVCVDFKVL